MDTNVLKALAILTRAALATGRTNRSTLEMLEESELEAILKCFQETYGEPATVKAYVEHPTGINRKIEAIKLVRDVTGSYLKDAKEFIEGTRAMSLNKEQYEKIQSFLRADGLGFLTN